MTEPPTYERLLGQQDIDQLDLLKIFHFIVAGFLRVFMPFGTALGVFTLIVLMRPNVKACFDGGAIEHESL